MISLECHQFFSIVILLVILVDVFCWGGCPATHSLYQLHQLYLQLCNLLLHISKRAVDKRHLCRVVTFAVFSRLLICRVALCVLPLCMDWDRCVLLLLFSLISSSFFFLQISLYCYCSSLVQMCCCSCCCVVRTFIFLYLSFPSFAE